MDPTRPTDDGSINGRLDEILSLTRENNKLIRGMRRGAIIGGVLKAIFWIALIGVSTYYTLKLLNPLIEQFVPSGTATSTMPSSAQIQELLQQYKQSQGK